jgi:hypothetical protein
MPTFLVFERRQGLGLCGFAEQLWQAVTVDRLFPDLECLDSGDVNGEFSCQATLLNWASPSVYARTRLEYVKSMFVELT